MKNERERISVLAQQFKDGNKKAFDELYALTNQKAYFVALQIVKDEHIAQDILQESYVRAIDKIQSLENTNSFVRWFHQIVTNRSMDYLRKRNPVLFEDGEDGAFEVIPDEKSDFSPEKNIDQEELRSTVMDAMNELTSEKRACVLMMYFEDMSVNEISESLNVPVSTVKNRLWTARKELKTKFERIGLTSAYSVAPMGVVAWALGKTAEAVSQTFVGNPETIKIISGISVAGTAAAASSAAASSAAAGTGFAAKAAALTTIQKIAAGIAIAGVITGSTVGITSFVKNNKTEEPTASYSEQVTETTSAVPVFEEEEEPPVQVVEKDEENPKHKSIYYPKRINEVPVEYIYVGTVTLGTNKIEFTENWDYYFCDFITENPGYYLFYFNDNEDNDIKTFGTTKASTSDFHSIRDDFSVRFVGDGQSFESEKTDCVSVCTVPWNDEYATDYPKTLAFFHEGTEVLLPIELSDSRENAELVIEYYGEKIENVEFLKNDPENLILGYNLNAPYVWNDYQNLYYNVYDLNFRFSSGKELFMGGVEVDYIIDDGAKVGENDAVFIFPHYRHHKKVNIYNVTDYVKSIEIENIEDFLTFDIDIDGFDVNVPEEYTMIVSFADGSTQRIDGKGWDKIITCPDGTELLVEFSQPYLTDREAVQFIVSIGDHEYIRELCRLVRVDPIGFTVAVAVFSEDVISFYLDIAKEDFVEIAEETETYEDFIRRIFTASGNALIYGWEGFERLTGYGLDWTITFAKILSENIII